MDIDARRREISDVGGKVLGHTTLYLIKGILLLQPEDVRLAEAHGDLVARRQMRRISTHSVPQGGRGEKDGKTNLNFAANLRRRQWSARLRAEGKDTGS